MRQSVPDPQILSSRTDIQRRPATIRPVGPTPRPEDVDLSILWVGAIERPTMIQTYLNDVPLSEALKGNPVELNESASPVQSLK